MITPAQWEAVRKHIVRANITLTVSEQDGTYIDEFKGICNGGSINLDGNSAVRRTASFSITPTDQITNISEQSLVWLNKNVTVTLYVNGEAFHMGEFLYTSANATYDSSTNLMTIELSDWMAKLDGTINGQIGGAPTIVCPAYKEDPETGEPLEYSTIKGYITKQLEACGITEYVPGGPRMNRYVVEEIGEYYCMPHPDHPEWNWQDFRARFPLWNTVPYDLEFSIGCTNWDIISELVNLYPNYEAYFDEYGTFRVNMIPSEYTTDYDFQYEDYVDMVISENVSTDLTTVRNVCEVWGATLDADWYANSVVHADRVDFSYQVWFGTPSQASSTYSIRLVRTIMGAGVPGSGTYSKEKTYTFGEYTNTNEDWYDIHISFSNHTLILSSAYDYLSSWSLGGQYYSGQAFYTCNYDNWGRLPDSYAAIFLNKANIASSDYVVILDGYPDDYRTSTRFGVKFVENSNTAQMMRINDLSPLPIIDFSTKQPIGANYFDLNEIHVFQITKVRISDDNYTHQIYYVGVAQAHAINVLTNGDVGPQVPYIDDMGVQRYVMKYSEDYYKIFLNCRHVTFTLQPDSPFVVQKLGDRLDVKADGEFSNIRSDELAIERAEYENWKNARLSDTVSITTKLMPFVEPNMKISYKKSGYNFVDDFIVQSVSHDFDQGTTTINMSTFYPLYRREPGNLYLMTYKYMSGFRNSELYGNQDLM